MQVAAPLTLLKVLRAQGRGAGVLSTGQKYPGGQRMGAAPGVHVKPTGQGRQESWRSKASPGAPAPTRTFP